MLKKLTSKNRQKGKKNSERGERERETEGGKEGKESVRERGEEGENFPLLSAKCFFQDSTGNKHIQIIFTQTFKKVNTLLKNCQDTVKIAFHSFFVCQRFV